ncbi:ABC transporter permease [Candidatus Woesearchaeota archaeon]|jgi:putative ABC transport system permease protein|nr:ABC transporter permease [Candidatus Woesearchaeota archaeon]MBT4150883.1 ABC transporter permease [Candidatus Woesearchaeota archaeon]MBT4246896.1 ABC transporter permease [Candidatus Woesearchaeota archaeon]MBT4433673.1 ABC transporter permease [Candidatus Woesearchaeota archaeon]
MIKDYFRLGYRNVKQRKLRSWLTMIGIFIGIAAVVALISLSQGLQDAVAQQFVQLGTDKLIVQAAGGGFGPPGAGVSEPLTEADEKAISKTKGVDLAIGRLIRTVKLEFKGETKFSFAVSMPEGTEERELAIEANNYQLKQGRFFEQDDALEVVLGNDFAKDFFDRPLELRNRVTIQNKVFKVSGILKKSGNPQQDSTLILPEGSLRNILNIENEFDIIPIKVKTGEDPFIVGENVEKQLRKSRNVEEGKENFIVETPQQLIGTLNNILLVIQGVLVGIAGISLIVGGIGIMNTMYTSVLERTKEIGIMKALGAKNKTIQFLFLVESGILGLFGGLIGVSLGVGISKFVEFVTFKVYESALIQASVSPYLILSALLFAFLVGAGSGVFPAKQAANLKPVEALRQ